MKGRLLVNHQHNTHIISNTNLHFFLILSTYLIENLKDAQNKENENVNIISKKQTDATRRALFTLHANSEVQATDIVIPRKPRAIVKTSHLQNSIASDVLSGLQSIQIQKPFTCPNMKIIRYEREELMRLNPFK